MTVTQKAQAAQTTGEVRGRLPAPRVAEAPDGHLTDAELGRPVRVRITPEGGVTSGQTYTLLWAGGRDKPVGYTDTVSVERPAEYVEFEVPPAYVTPHLDQVVPVAYVVEDGEGERTGDTLRLRIGEADAEAGA
ncbi:hypothetical protein ACFY7C_20560 [Streptomyces sp. NPDC012769]|uniref:hypothetical protein n=1 Tax=Streptomyces sp. NPDC012769 TaxID=3364848 RepID=UPI0036BD28B9